MKILQYTLKYRLAGVLFGFLCLGCAFQKNVPMPEEVQANIEGWVKGRHYGIDFNSSYVVESNAYMERDVNGYFWIQDDTVLLYIAYPTFGIFRKFKMQNYCQSRTNRGEIVITFSIERPKEMCYKREDKDVPVPFRLTFRSMEKIVVNIDGSEDYKGEFIYRYIDI